MSFPDPESLPLLHPPLFYLLHVSAFPQTMEVAKRLLPEGWRFEPTEGEIIRHLQRRTEKARGKAQEEHPGIDFSIRTIAARNGLLQHPAELPGECGSFWRLGKSELPLQTHCGSSLTSKAVPTTVGPTPGPLLLGGRSGLGPSDCNSVSVLPSISQRPSLASPPRIHCCLSVWFRGGL